MIQLRKPSEETRLPSSPDSVITNTISPMEHKSSDSSNKENPFTSPFHDPLCDLNLKETSEFVKSLPVKIQRSQSSNRVIKDFSIQKKREGAMSSSRQGRLMESPSTPGRSLFNFTHGVVARKSVSSKWEDAEKWIVNTTNSCRESPAHSIKPVKSSDPSKISKQNCGFEKKRMSLCAADVFLKDKFTDNSKSTVANLQYIEPAKETLLFKNSELASQKINHRDIGTEMTPVCHTPIKSNSPARHNTPASKSGLLVPHNNTNFDLAELNDCHLAKLKLSEKFDSMILNWNSKEEEEEEISKSLRHFDVNCGGRKSFAESRACAWEEEERTKSCMRYQREEAKIQAWVNLQNAKAEAESRKLEVKIQKMRSNLEEKLMKRMAIVHRKTEEWRAQAQLQHSQQIQRAYEQPQKIKINNNNTNNINFHFPCHVTPCSCMPCNNNP